MAEKKDRRKTKGPQGFEKDLYMSPEWVSLRIRKTNTLLYVVAIFIGIGLCIGTLSVLLS